MWQVSIRFCVSFSSLDKHTCIHSPPAVQPHQVTCSRAKRHCRRGRRRAGWRLLPSHSRFARRTDTTGQRHTHHPHKYAVVAWHASIVLHQLFGRKPCVNYVRLCCVSLIWIKCAGLHSAVPYHTAPNLSVWCWPCTAQAVTLTERLRMSRKERHDIVLRDLNNDQATLRDKVGYCMLL